MVMSLYFWLNRASMMNLQKLDLQAGWEAFTLSISYINKCIKKHSVAGSLKFDVCPIMYVCSVHLHIRVIPLHVVRDIIIIIIIIWCRPLSNICLSTRFSLFNALYIIFCILYIILLYYIDTISECARGARRINH